MDYMTLKEASRKVGRDPSTGKLLLRRRPYPRRCENGRCLADSQGCGKTAQTSRFKGIQKIILL